MLRLLKFLALVCAVLVVLAVTYGPGREDAAPWQTYEPLPRTQPTIATDGTISAWAGLDDALPTINRLRGESGLIRSGSAPP